MKWDFTIADVSTWSSLSAVDVLALEAALASPSPFDNDDQPQPWIELGGLITTDDGQVLSFYVLLLDDFLRRRRYEVYLERGYYEPLAQLAGGPNLFIAPWDEPRVLVDAPYFDWSLVDRLLFDSPQIRRRIMWPVRHTDDEMAELLDLETGYTEEDTLRHAVCELEGRFGSPLRIEADEAAEAASLLRNDTFLREPTALFRLHGHCFSPEVRRRILEYRYDEDPF